MLLCYSLWICTYLFTTYSSLQLNRFVFRRFTYCGLFCSRFLDKGISCLWATWRWISIPNYVPVSWNEVFSFFWLIFSSLLFPSNGQPLNLFYSTDSSINNLYGNDLRIPLFKSAELDDNRDGKTDRLEMSFQVPLAPTEMISGVTALTYYNVQLKNKVKYIFDAVSVIDYDSSSFISQLDVDGDLMLRQKWPLISKGG